MSPRAACRLEALGFSELYDYVAGKAGWLGRNLPIEGEHADRPTAGHLLRTDVVTCAPDDSPREVCARIDDSAYGFALVTSRAGVLLGRLRRSAQTEDQGSRVDEVMAPPPCAHTPRPSGSRNASPVEASKPPPSPRPTGNSSAPSYAQTCNAQRLQTPPRPPEQPSCAAPSVSRFPRASIRPHRWQSEKFKSAASGEARPGQHDPSEQPLLLDGPSGPAPSTAIRNHAERVRR